MANAANRSIDFRNERKQRRLPRRGRKAFMRALESGRSLRQAQRSQMEERRGVGIERGLCQDVCHQVVASLMVALSSAFWMAFISARAFPRWWPCRRRCCGAILNQRAMSPATMSRRSHQIAQCPTPMKSFARWSPSAMPAGRNVSASQERSAAPALSQGAPSSLIGTRGSLPRRWRRCRNRQADERACQPDEEDRGAVGQGRRGAASPSAAGRGDADTRRSYPSSVNRTADRPSGAKRGGGSGGGTENMARVAVVAFRVRKLASAASGCREIGAVGGDRKVRRTPARCWQVVRTSSRMPNCRGAHLGLREQDVGSSQAKRRSAARKGRPAERQRVPKKFPRHPKSWPRKPKQLQAMISMSRSTRSRRANPAGCADRRRRH